MASTKVTLGIIQPTGNGRQDYSLDTVVMTDYVYFNSASPYTGNTYPVGTARYPVNNVADLEAICLSRNLNSIMLLSTILLDRPMRNYNFAGKGSQYVILNGQNVDQSTFTNVGVIGTQGAVTTTGPSFYDCYLAALTNFAPNLILDSIVAGSIALAGDFKAFSSSFYAGMLDSLGHNVDVYGSTGYYTIRFFNAPALHSFLEMISGSVVLDPSCTAGILELRGDFVLTDGSAGTAVVDNRTSVHIQAIEDTIYYDSVNGVPGTIYPIGTPQQPVNNEADLRTICTARHTNKVSIKGLLAPTASMEYFSFVGYGVGLSELNIAGAPSVNQSTFENLYVHGASTGTIAARQCRIEVNGIGGAITDSSIVAIQPGSGAVNATGCIIEGNVDGAHIFSSCGFIGTPNVISNVLAGNLEIYGSYGQIEVGDVTGGNTHIELSTGSVILDATCAGGVIDLLGNSLLTDNSAGSTVNDYRIQREYTEDAIYFDAVNGEAGTTYPIGSRSVPVDNLPDLRTICAARGITRVVLLSDMTLDADMHGYNFVGDRGSFDPLGGAMMPVFDPNSNDIDDCYFENIYLAGTGDSTVDTVVSCYRCHVELEGIYTLILNECILSGITAAAGASGFPEYYLLKCQVAGGGLNFDGLECHLYMHDCRSGPSGPGSYTLQDMTHANCSAEVDLDGVLEIDASCTNGRVILSGDCILVNNGTLPQFSDYRISGLLTTRFFQETAAATDVNGTTWENLFDYAFSHPDINRNFRICGFMVTIAGGWAGNCQLRIVDGAGTTKIFPFAAQLVQGTDFTSGTQYTFDFPCEVSAFNRYKLQFRSTAGGDGAGKTCELNNLDVQELS